MYPGHWGVETPDKPVIIMAGSGEIVTHRQLDERSTRLAQWLRSAGLQPGDHLAVFMENSPWYHVAIWAGMRSGLIITTVNRYLTADEAGYIVDDCDAKALITTRARAEVAAAVPALAPRCELRLMAGGTVEGYDSLEDALAGSSPEPLADEPAGDFMLYSSGTTGRPKGIKRPRSGGTIDNGTLVAKLLAQMFGFTGDDIYLSPAPLYHTAPLGFTTALQSLGGTTVIMEHFDAAKALAAIERYQVTCSQWVPTMFSRLLKLPEEQRTAHDLSSHKTAIHAAAPCPRPVKEAMFDWWGPIIWEYYAGTELNGLTLTNPQDWLAHPGTVGKPVLGKLHVCDEAGDERSVGEIGTVYFEQPVMPFEYHKDPGQTKDTQHPVHPNWSTLNDVGRVDEDGFLYLTDRATFMIISGGVNIYPQEIEDVLITHPKVDDVAVFGVPNADLGEEVKAVVQPRPGIEPGPDLETELIAYCRDRLTHFKCPKSVAFQEELPRLPTGKLYKRLLRDPYWGKGDSKIV